MSRKRVLSASATIGVSSTLPFSTMIISNGSPRLFMCLLSAVALDHILAASLWTGTTRLTVGSNSPAAVYLLQSVKYKYIIWDCD
jgi:hypothetical protein